ncbi:MAG: DUF2911 domain-containing protein [Flavobacteriales bacterium]
MYLKKIATLAFACLCFVQIQAQSLKTPAPSPLCTMKQAFGLSDITVEYSRPSAKGRVVYGNVVPYDQLWRTGANGSTLITFGDDVTIEGKAVKAGTYSIYSIPGKTSWDIMLNTDTKLGGNVGEYDKAKEVARFTVKSQAVTEMVETFTINVADISANAAEIEIVWEKTKVSFRVETEIDSKIMANIEKAVIQDNKPYFQAARYYYENDKDMNQALTWINKAVESNPGAYWVLMVKANIQYKLNDMKGAKETANKVVEIATADGDSAYVRQGKELLAKIK